METQTKKYSLLNKMKNLEINIKKKEEAKIQTETQNNKNQSKTISDTNKGKSISTSTNELQSFNISFGKNDSELVDFLCKEQAKYQGAPNPYAEYSLPFSTILKAILTKGIEKIKEEQKQQYKNQNDLSSDTIFS